MDLNRKIWCDKADCTIDEINSRALEVADRFPTGVYLSLDLYSKLLVDMGSSLQRHNPSYGPNVVCIRTATADLNVHLVKRLKNFMLVGRKEDMDALEKQGIDQMFWNDEEKARINKAFEDVVLLEGKNET